MDHFVRERVVAITGGSSGFGLEAARILQDRGLLAEADEKPRHAFVISGALEGDPKFMEIGSRFLGRRIQTLERALWGVDVGKVLV